MLCNTRKKYTKYSEQTTENSQRKKPRRSEAPKRFTYVYVAFAAQVFSTNETMSAAACALTVSR